LKTCKAHAAVILLPNTNPEIPLLQEISTQEVPALTPYIAKAICLPFGQFGCHHDITPWGRFARDFGLDTVRFIGRKSIEKDYPLK
jgi:hypothetical protein